MGDNYTTGVEPEEARRFVIECWSLQGVAYVVIGLRYFSRIRQVGWRKLALDDFFMLLALFAYTAESFMPYIFVSWCHGLANNGMTDEHRATLSRDSDEYKMRVNGAKLNVSGLLLYTTLLWLLKGCWTVYYTRLTADICFMRRWMLGAYIIMPLTYIACVCVALLQCVPLHRQWQIYPDPGNHCQPAISVLQTVFVMVMNTATDFYLLGIPVPMLWKSNLPWSQKLVLFIMFSGGFLEMTFGIMRCVSILTKGNRDPAQTGYWSVRESFVSFVLTNMPMVYPLIRRSVLRAIYSLGGCLCPGSGTNSTTDKNDNSIGSNGVMLTRYRSPYPIDSPVFPPTYHGSSHRWGSNPDPIAPIPGSQTFWLSTTDEEGTTGTNTTGTTGTTGTGPRGSGEDISRKDTYPTAANRSGGMLSFRSTCESPTRSRNDCGRPALAIQTAGSPYLGVVTSVESSGMIAEQPHHG
ncbi:hypothetical protein QR685DRAFT_551955 [Neurospora intermedia]|uniref:Rhodopsin domain-containing protein n=1 Tax=Neurospora intermedia TaxID=5142 RepID=A0ABR3DFE3_NEUIN